MGAALVLLLVGLGALAAGVLIGRYYVPDDRQLRRTARHSRAYMRALSHLIARDHDTAIAELRGVVEESVDDVEPYFALGAMFRGKGEHERAIRVHQALAVRERDRRKLRQRALFELGLDFRAAGMPRRATRAMEEVLLEEPAHESALRVLAALYEEQARFSEAAGLWQRLGRRRNEDTSAREHHLLVAGAQAALGRDDLDSARQLLKAAHKHRESGHFFAAAAELAAARGNHTGARARLVQALTAAPALAPLLVPGLIAAEQALAGGQGATGAPPDLDDEPAEAPEAAPRAAGAPGLALTTLAAGGDGAAAGAADGASMVPAVAPPASVAERVLAVLAEVEATTGPRLELALIRAQLAPAASPAARSAHAASLATAFPAALAARVMTGRVALDGSDGPAVRAALDALVGEHGALAWALRGRWMCGHCGVRPAAFSWRCAGCRRWATLRMETGIEPAPAPPRERRAAARSARPAALLGTGPAAALPAPTLDPGLSADELAEAGARRSLLGRVGTWFSGPWNRDR